MAWLGEPELGSTGQSAASAVQNSNFSRFQAGLLAVFFVLYALDGYDMLSLAFALPGIRETMKLGPAALGGIISVGLVGTGVGSLLISPLGDRYGRKPLMIGCLAASFCGMICCSIALDAPMLAIGRFATGVGVGGLLPAVTALAVEYTPLRLRNSAAAFVTIGYPAGGVLGGALAAQLLQSFDWRSVFVCGAIATGAMALLTIWHVPESLEFLEIRRKDQDLSRVNAILAKLNVGALSSLSHGAANRQRGSAFDIFRRALIGTTLIITGSYALHGATFYYSVNWLPKIATDLSFTAVQAAQIAAWCSAGGMAGASLIAWMAPKVDIRILTPATLASAGICLIFLPLSGGFFIASATLLGACLYGGQSCLYAFMMHAFPVHARATGAGFVTGVGRIGGILSPLLSGFLFSSGYGNVIVGVAMGMGSLLGAACVLFAGRYRPTVAPAF